MTPTSPQLCVGRVAQVIDETSDEAYTEGIEGLDDLDMAPPEPDEGVESSSIADDGPSPEDPMLTADIDPEQLNAMEEAQRTMDDARARLAEVPAEVVITNHVMGLYELAAIHLSSSPADLAQSALAIDAVACLVDGLGDRLGSESSTMRDALNNIRLAFVQIKGTD